jgi:uncharacterized protein (TIGR00661 family)
MRILYGVQTTGNGHISRSLQIIRHLKVAGHDVRVLFSGAGRHGFWSWTVFEPFEERTGFTFVTDHGRVRYLRTALNLRLGQFVRDVWTFDARGIDLVVSDFEPVSAMIARLRGIPSVGISHQNAFKYPVPKPRGGWLGRAVIHLYAPARIDVGLHWHHFDQPLLPPVIDPTLTADGSVEAGLILVYLPFEDSGQVLGLLGEFPELRFHWYCAVDRPLTDWPVRRLPFDRPRFVDDLKACTGVICQAGFELPSEALHLGKKILVKPVHNQFEQLANGDTLCRLGLGHTMHELDAGSVRDWLSAPLPPAAGYPDVAAAIARWLDTADGDGLKSLASTLWSRTPHDRLLSRAA